MKKVVIVGAGSWGIRLSHYIISDKKFEVIGFLDDYRTTGDLVGNIPVIGAIEDATSLFLEKRFDGFLMAIGYDHFEQREMIFESLKKQGIPPFIFSHSSAYVDPSAQIGAGTIICPCAFIDMEADIKENVYIGTQSHLSHNSAVDSSSYIGPSVVVAGGCYIGKKCMIGVGAILRDGMQIVDNVTVGAGSLVVKNIDASDVYVGIPAKKMKNK